MTTASDMDEAKKVREAAQRVLQEAWEPLGKPVGRGAWHVDAARPTDDGGWEIDICNDGAPDVTFDMLSALSEAFRTKRINLSRWEYGYCETCAGQEVQITVDTLDWWVTVNWPQ